MASILNATTSSGLVTSADNSGSLQLATNNGTTAVTIDTSQKVGIGTTSPDSKLHVKSTVDNTTNGLTLEYDAGTAYKSRMFVRGNDLYVSSDTGNTGGATLFLNGGTERMRITSGGIVRINNTSDATFSAQLNTQFTTSKNCGIYLKVTDTNSSQSMILFGNTTSDAVGGISTSGSATSYATSSDYRLKENIAPMTGALATVSQLKPCTYTWKVDGSAGQGFIAHELQAVVPDAVTGEKDGEQMQGIDTSFLVATLTAAIQELKAELDATKAEVQALKGTL